MPPRVRLVHVMPGRARLRAESAEALKPLGEALGRLPQVTRVAVSPLGKSLLLRHTGPLEPILDQAEKAGLLNVAQVAPAGAPPLTGIYERFAALDRRLKAGPDGWGLATWTFYGLAGASVYQLLRGRFLPAGGALAFQALSILLQGRETERKPSG